VTVSLGASVCRRVVRLFAATLLCVAPGFSQEATLPPPRAGLQAVPIPQLDAVEPAVVEQLGAAERQLRDAIAQRAATRDLASAYGSLAQLFHAYEIFDSAEPAYLNAIRLAPGEVRWPYLLGYLYQQTGRFDEAMTKFQAVQQLQPGHRESSARLADVFLRVNRLREARERFRELTDVYPAFARNGLGEIALREGRFEEAADHFRRALERAPRATSLHYSLAMAYRGLGRLEQARVELEQRGPGGITLGDPTVDSLTGLVRGERLLVIQGRRALDGGDLRAAADWFTRAVAVAPQSTAARTNLGSVLVQLGEPDNAIEQFQEVTRLEPGDEDARLTLAILLSERLRFRDAVALLSEAYARSPQSVRTATTLARLLAASPDAGLRDGARALEIAMSVYTSDNSPVHAETVALALAELRRCSEALAWMRKAVAAAEQSGDAGEAGRLKGELGKYACQ
jgi:tetratricopeptide (TPR) repeat protein